MTTPTAFEQLTVELINQARLNPHGEFDRWVTNAPANVQSAISFFNVDLVLLRQQFDALTPVAPLAWNNALGVSSQAHTQAMLNADEQSHQVAGEPSLSQRVTNAGYSFSAVGENIFAFADDAAQAHAAFFIDWGFTPTGIQQPPGHRNNIMNSAFTEVGVGHLTDNLAATSVGPNLVTHNLGNRFDYAAQITGVIFDDADGDHFYDIGEGSGGVTVTSAAGMTSAFSTGGYNLAAPAGKHTLTFSGALGTAAITVSLGAANVKVDMYDPGSFRSSATSSLGAGAASLELLGELAIDAAGNSLDNWIAGNSADNILLGAGGIDTLIGGRGNDTLSGDTVPNPALLGNFLYGGEGDDTYHVHNTFDAVVEGAFFPELGFGGFNTIISHANWYWDRFNGGYVLTVAENADDPSNAGTTIVGSVFSNQMIGNSKTNVMFGRGGSDIYRAGDGIDYISLSLMGVNEGNSYVGVDGPNTVIVERRASGSMSYDIIFEFQSGKDKLNVADYGFASQADVFARGVDAGDNSYFVLGDGFDYLYMIGLNLSELSAGDFVV